VRRLFNIKVILHSHTSKIRCTMHSVLIRSRKIDKEMHLRNSEGSTVVTGYYMPCAVVNVARDLFEKINAANISDVQ
jgi:hypothetical protein